MGEEAEHRESERDRLDGIIRTKEAKLIELGPQLASILSSTVPVQDYLGMPLSDKREQISLARLFSSQSLHIVQTVPGLQQGLRQGGLGQGQGGWGGSQRVQGDLKRG